MNQPLKNTFWYGIVASVVIVGFFLNSLLLNISSPLDFIYLDAYHVQFLIKHYLHILATGDYKDILSAPLFYGFKYPQLYAETFFAPILLALPIGLITNNLIFTYNFLAFLTILLSFISMYVFVYFLTKRVFPSLIASIIFVLNPFVFGHFPDRIQLYSLQWIPLIFLCIEKILNRPSYIYSFLFFLFLTLQLFTSMYYFAFLTVILPIYFLVRLKQKKTKLSTIINAGTVFGFIILLASGLWFASLYKEVITNLSSDTTLSQVEKAYSNWPTDYFFTSGNNLVYGGLREQAIAKSPDLVAPGLFFEHGFFWGITLLVVFILSFFYIEEKDKKYRYLLLSLLVLCLILSFGPVIHVSQNIKFPGLYSLVYLFDPLFNYLRVASRFGLFVYFFLGIIIAISFRWKSILGVILICLILFEYWNKPLVFTELPEQPREVYGYLDSLDQIKVILEMPIGNRLPPGMLFSRNEDRDSNYLIYATYYHSKDLFNGFGSFFPKEYQKRAALLSIGFPKPSQLQDLNNWGVDAIVLHKNEYASQAEFEIVKNGLLNLKIPLLKSADDLMLFDLTKLK